MKLRAIHTHKKKTLTLNRFMLELIMMMMVRDEGLKHVLQR